MMYALQKIDPPFCGISGIFSPTSKYSVCEDVKMMYTLPKLGTPILWQTWHFFANF